MLSRKTENSESGSSPDRSTPWPMTPRDATGTCRLRGLRNIPGENESFQGGEIAKSIWKGLPFVLFCLVLLSSCSMPLVGKRVSYVGPFTVPIGAGGEFTGKTEYFDFRLTLRRTEKPDIYILDGNAAYIGPPLGTNRSRTVFYLLPVRGEVILDIISFVPASNSIGKNLSIQKTFSCTGGFDTLLILCQVSIVNG